VRARRKDVLPAPVVVDTPRVAPLNNDGAPRGTTPRRSLTGLVGRGLGGVPPTALVLLGIVSVQMGSALAKQLFGEVGSFGAVALRLFFAATILMLLWRPSPRMSRRAWTVVVAYGLTLGLMNLCFYLALDRLPLGIAVTVEFLGPLAVALIGSRRWLDALWALLAGGGVALLMGGGGEVDLVGLLFALGAGVCWGLYIVVSAALGRHTTDGNGLALGMTVAALVAVPMGVADSGAALVQPWVLLAGLGLALLSSVVPYSLDLEALRRMPTRVFGILMSLEPAMAALIGLVVLQEMLHWSQWVAVLCVVIASVGATRGARPEVRPEDLATARHPDRPA
jgi:inner membrane transporter RhtA